jgi:DNA-binding HxlR family transcriptional regulator
MAFKSLVEEPRCQVVRTLEIVGEKWTLLIVRNALRGQTRFSEFRDQLGIPSDILTARLVTLVEAGILQKSAYRNPGDRERFSYHLTESGSALKLVVAALTQWGDEFNPSPWGAASVLVEKHKRQKVGLAFVDDSGNQIRDDQVEIVPGPASVVNW